MNGNLEGRITLRPARGDDEAFLYAVYSSTRAAEMALLGWDGAQQHDFLAMQFTAQHRYYHSTYANADYLIVECDGRPAGRLYLDRAADHMLVIDVALLPEYRGVGIGTYLMADLLAEARRSRRPVRLHVEPGNPARRLYERLGFRVVAEHGFYWLMECAPSSEATT